MNISKKLVSLALAGTTLITFSGALLPVASAQSVTDLQAQIAALLTQIQQLQSQLNSASGSSMSSSYNYTRDLTVGSSGADVKALQQFLNANGAQIAASGAGSPGHESTYFGALTKAAVAKYQAAHGISPAAGYFGAKSRAYVASLSASTPSTSSTPSVPAPASGLVVSLSSQNPSAGALISSASTAAARVPVMAVNLTAGNSGAVTVSELKFNKTGVISDSSISGAYLVENGQVLYQYNSISNGVIDFAGLNLNVNAGATRTLWLAIDPSTGLTAGNTVGFAIAAASNVSATSGGAAVSASGAFPLSGNTFTVTTVTNPSIASLTITSSSIATTDTAGTQNNIVGSWNFSVSNSKVWLKGLKFTVIGSANNADLRNVKIMVNGTQAGTTLASVGADGTAYFDMSSNPGTLNTGSNNIQVYSDVMGSPNKNFQFEILNSYDLYAVDSQYNVPIAGSSNTGTQVSIQQGQITVSQAADTPTGNLAPGQSNVTLAKYTIYAAGEAVKVKFLTFKMTFGNSTTTLSNEVKNVALTDDAGGQVGTTINTPPSATTNTCDITVGGGSNTSYTGGVYTDCFGTGTSPINYIVPANTTRVLSIKADIQSGADFGTVVASLTGNTSNLQGLTSSASNSSGGATGSSLTLQSTQLTTAQNTALGNQTVASPSSNVKIGSYALTASSADGVTVSNLTVKAGATAFLSNLHVMINGSQFGSTQGLVSSGGSYSFSGTPFTVAKGGTTYVDVYADILSGAASVSPASTLSSCSGTGQTSYNALTCSSTAGQGITIAGQATVSVTADSSQAPAGQIVMGSSQNPLATFRFTETTNAENVKVTDLTVADTVSSTSTVKSTFSNLTLYNGSTAVGTAGSAVTSGTALWAWTFHFATPFVVPQANSISLTLKGDASSYASSGATDNANHQFNIANGSAVTALGATSNSTSSVSTTSAAGNTQTVLRSKLSFAATALGSTTGRSKSTSDNFATLSFSADSAGAVALNTMVVSFTGNAVSGTGFLDGIKILDENNQSIGTVQSTSSAATCQTVAAGGSGSCSVTFNFGSTSNGQQISAGSTRNWTLQVNDSKTQASTGQNVTSLAATVSTRSTDVLYTDGLDSAANSNITLPSSQLFPIQLNSASFAQGT
ncbi:MAG: peptidoglycan-binding protein [Patescibacteria group bacterium]|nr:peptidoglycan-binding protein [Patescibacteria group bacterium]MDE2015074.1 peptidoglycan-binding protein [Patescibacteria group bacterium]MDE2226502.1 peptidoglycan-binding protein [Patescibacteria group bacterium]